jgi:hypothetical protein
MSLNLIGLFAVSIELTALHEARGGCCFGWSRGVIYHSLYLCMDGMFCEWVYRDGGNGR